MAALTVTSGDAIDPKAFWMALGQRATGMTVVTAEGDDGPTGFLGLSAAHVTASPATMLVSVDTGRVLWPAYCRGVTSR